MREMKFRLWDKKWKRMVSNLCPIDNENALNLAWVKNYDGDYTVMQYTGLKDKNSVEIYEGDIISTGEEDRRFVIIPMLGGLSVHHVCFMGEAYNELVSMPTNDAQTAQWLSENTVIGNIHETTIDEARDKS